MSLSLRGFIVLKLLKKIIGYASCVYPKLQTFRQFREMFDQQKAVLEQRYRGLLEEAVQDAIFLSTRNNELMQENQGQKQGQFPVLTGHKCVKNIISIAISQKCKIYHVDDHLKGINAIKMLQTVLISYHLHLVPCTSFLSMYPPPRTHHPHHIFRSSSCLPF